MSFCYFCLLFMVLCNGVHLYFLDQAVLNSWNSAGQYRNGVVKIYAYKHDNSVKYMGTAIHEWAHYLYDVKLNSSEREEWVSLYSIQGMESGYPYNSSGTDAKPWEEEFAECGENMIMNEAGVYVGVPDCSSEKYEWIRRVWR